MGIFRLASFERDRHLTIQTAGGRLGTFFVTYRIDASGPDCCRHLRRRKWTTRPIPFGIPRNCFGFGQLRPTRVLRWSGVVRGRTAAGRLQLGRRLPAVLREPSAAARHAELGDPPGLVPGL
jgi:hypothetical protein